MHSQTHFGLFITALLDGFGLNVSFGAMTTLKLALNGTQRRKYEQVARTDAAGHRASVLVLVLGRRAPGLGCCFLL